MPPKSTLICDWPTSEPSSQSEPPARTQSITALGQRFASGSFNSHTPALGPTSSESSVVTIENGSLSEGAVGGGEADLQSKAKDAVEMDYLNFEDETKAVLAAAGEVEGKTTPKASEWGARMDTEPSAATPTLTATQGLTSENGSPRKRTAEEIEQKRLEAQARKAQRAAEAEQRARQKKREEDRARYRQIADQTLAAYGFGVKAGAGSATTYGSGAGGGLEGEGAAAWSGERERRPYGAWEPNASCSEEQRKVLQQVDEGKNVFFTGSAGVGKSFLLHEIRRLLEARGKRFQVTATTGIAALQVNGSTLHSWAGVGLGKECVAALADKVLTRKKAKESWHNCQVLIIDEISMLDPTLFTKLDLIGKLARENTRPFGGIQLVVCGDFFQLPPVEQKHADCMRCGEDLLEEISLDQARLPHRSVPREATTHKVLRCSDRFVKMEKKVGCGFEWRNVTFVFETDAWAECDFHVLELTKVFRQSDKAFISVLERFRRGICDDECIKMLSTCGKGLSATGALKIKPTNLYPRREDVARENQGEFNKLKEKIYTFDALDASRGERGPLVMAARLKDVPADPKVQLKKGSQVLLLANLDLKGGLVNGSRGVIVDWIRGDELNLEDTGRKDASDAWREEAAQHFLEKQSDDSLPLVTFASGATIIIRPHTWSIRIDRDTSVSRTQIPVSLAWALTIHKSQGQSLDAVGVRLNKTFEKGQAYVALSRCRTPEGMQVHGFKEEHIMAHPTVLAFYHNIAKNLHYITSPVPPLNPLDFIPTSSPVLLRVSRIFGGISRPPPVGSAVLIPGQAGPPPPATFAANPTPAPFPKRLPNWRRLLQEAAEAYLDASPDTAGEGRATAFAREAESAIRRRTGDFHPVHMNIGPLLTAIPESQKVKKEESLEAASMDRSISTSTEDTSTDEPAKKKRKRKSRVGR